MAEQFLLLNTALVQALDKLPDSLGISDEVQEQVGLLIICNIALNIFVFSLTLNKHPCGINVALSGGVLKCAVSCQVLIFEVVIFYSKLAKFSRSI